MIYVTSFYSSSNRLKLYDIIFLDIPKLIIITISIPSKNILPKVFSILLNVTLNSYDDKVLIKGSEQYLEAVFNLFQLTFG